MAVALTGPAKRYYDDAQRLKRSPKDKAELSRLAGVLLPSEGVSRKEFLDDVLDLIAFFEEYDREVIQEYRANPDTATGAAGKIIMQLEERGPWLIKIVLAWLCWRHPSEAQEFYDTSCLKRQQRYFHSYIGHPNQWTDNDQAANIKSAVTVASSSGDIAKPAWRCFSDPNGISYADFSRCGRLIATAGKASLGGAGGADVLIWSFKGDDVVGKRVATHGSDVLCLAFAPGADFILSSSKYRAIISDARQPTAPLCEVIHRKQISHCAFSNSGKIFSTASHDKTACVWDVETGRLIMTANPTLKRNHVVNSAYFSPDDDKLLIACSDCSVQIWDIKSECLIGSLEGGQQDWVCGAMFSRDGSTIIVAGPEDGTASLWDAESRSLIAVLGEDESHEDTIWSAEFSPDEARVVTASEDRNAFIWDVKSRKVVRKIAHPTRLYVAHFSPDGQSILTACDNGSAYLWNIGNL